MINITNKDECCGCSACVQICPKQCISFNEDLQGFRYPSIDADICINCGLCSKVCPFFNHGRQNVHMGVFAAVNSDDEIRIRSSSGGLLSLLAQQIIIEGGIVFGARFDENWEVKHDWAETIEQIAMFRGSKYVQSRIEGCYKTVQSFLNEGRTVLFSGTPCQILGLKNFLIKEYDNLITVGIVCHGVPSPLIWRDYLKTIKGQNRIKTISTRYKDTSWRNYKYCIVGINNNVLVNESSSKNIYHKIFLNNLSIRPSCFNCPAKGGYSRCDIILGDCWGIEHFFPDIDDDKGISCVICESQKGMDYIHRLNCSFWELRYDDYKKYNSCIEDSTKRPIHYFDFWDQYIRDGFPTLKKYSTDNKSIICRLLDKFKSYENRCNNILGGK